MASVENPLDDEGYRQGDSDRPGGHHQRRHASGFTGATHAQWVRNAVVSVQRDCAQMHDGRRRQRDVTSGPGEARVEAEIPVAKYLRMNTD